MPRNGSGTYSVPNSFTPATTIVSADVNANFDDIGDELSNSLAVDGQSAMSGPLKAANGSNAAPSVTFASDLDTGLFRDAANNPAMSAGGTKVEEWESALRTHLVPTAWPAAVDVASAGTADVLGAASDFVRITGTTTITSLGTGAGRLRFVWFADALTLTHNATSLILPGGANITTAAGDAMILRSDGSSNVRVLSYAQVPALAATETSAGVLEIGTAAEYRANTASKALVTDRVWAAAAEVTLTDAATIAVDMSTLLNAIVTLAGNHTLGQPSNTKVGQSGCIRIVQDATGGRTLAYHSDWKFSGSDPVLSTGANATDLLFYQVIATNFIYATLIRTVA